MKPESATEKYKDFCPICNMPDDDKNLCRCDYVSPGKMIEEMFR